MPGKTYNLRFVAVIVVATAIGCPAVIWMMHADTRREASLQAMSAEELQAMASRNDADLLVLYVAAEKLAANGNGQKAWQLADKELPSVPVDDTSDLAKRFHTLAALLCAEFSTSSRAVALLDTLTKSDPTDPHLLLVAGEIAAHEGDMKSACSNFLTATGKMPTNSDAWRRLGRAYLAIQFYVEAVGAYKHAVAISPNDAHLHASLADALGKSGQFQEALTHSVLAAKLAPDNSRFAMLPAINRAIAARSEGEYDNAAAMLRDQLSRQPGNGPLLALLAGLQLRFNHLSEARKTQQLYLARARTDFGGWLDLEEMCKRQADDRSAQDAHIHFQRLIEIDDTTHDLARKAQLQPDDATKWFKLSIALHRAGKHRQAYYALMKAAQVDPSNETINMMLNRVQPMMKSPESDSDAESSSRSTNFQ